MSNVPWWASEDLWRKTAIWVTAGMAIVLIVLTFDTVAVITAGHSRVPAFEVINKRIYYRMNTQREFQEPVIGADAPLFGKMLSPEEAEAMVSHGKMTLQARNCTACHTILGNGAYYAPDLTKAWLDPGWAGESAREMLMVKFLMDPTTNARGYGAKRQCDAVAPHAAVPPPKAEPEDNGQGEHEGALEPAQHTGRLPQHLADKKHGKRGDERDDPRQPEGCFSGHTVHVGQNLSSRSASISSAEVP